MNNVFLTIRATLFWIGFAISTLLTGLIAPVLMFLPYEISYKILQPWTIFNVWWLKLTCGVDYQILGLENIDPDNRGIILSNHQSTWETFIIPATFPPLSWVLKKELFKIPFFGWALSTIKPIAIDRKAGSSAIEQVKNNGKKRLDDGNWVCIFPEGTRVKPGTNARYRAGGALLAKHCAETSENGEGYPVYPLAHNAGECWPRHSYIKKPGKITVSIGKPFTVKGMEISEINDKVKSWIEAETEKMPPAVKLSNRSIS